LALAARAEPRQVRRARLAREPAQAAGNCNPRSQGCVSAE
jgi:hypothetical protein